MFSNGTEYMIFMENYCYQCTRYKADKDGIPYRNSCKYENHLFAHSMYGGSIPSCIIKEESNSYVKCTKFSSVNERTKERRKYKRKQIEGQIHL